MTLTEAYFFRFPSDDKSGVSAGTRTVEEQETEEEKVIRCRNCAQPVTRVQDRISVDGAHTHTFANPSGIIYEIGCFRSAVGCGSVGPATDEFTWFRGYSWRTAYCQRCLTHLGWLFVSAGGDAFWGLILDRLTEPE